MKSWKEEYEPKVFPTTSYILERGNGWIIILIHLHLLNIAIHQYQANNIMLHISLLNYHPSYEQVIILFEIFFPKFNLIHIFHL
jgi:hypothetical protein